MTRRARQRRQQAERAQHERRPWDAGQLVINEAVLRWAIARLDATPEGSAAEQSVVRLLASLDLPFPEDVRHRVRRVLHGGAS